jgi:glycosyltransferase involved in cell wall biosynthesis
MTTIAVVASCVNEPYHYFINQWKQSIGKLERRPDEVIIATDLVNEVTQSDDCILVPIKNKPKSGNWTVAVNDAIAHSQSDWISKIDIDDLILPHALNEIDSCEADVYCFGIEIDGQKRLAEPNGLLEQPDPKIFSNSVYRRWVWEKNPYQDIFCEDALFWYLAACENAVFAASTKVDYIYGRHSSQITASLNIGEALVEVHRRRLAYLARTRE